MTWFDDLLGRMTIPTPAGSGKPASPIAPFPELTPAQIRDLRIENRYRRNLGVQVSPGLVAYPQILLAALALNQFGLEDYYPDEIPFWAAVTEAAGAAGKFSRIGLVNPAGSGVLGVVSYMAGTPGAADQVAIQLFPPNTFAFPGAVIVAAPRDTRFGTGVPATGAGNKITFNADNTQGVVGTGFSPGLKPGSTTQAAEWTGTGEKGLLVLSPGWTVLLAANTAAEALTAEFRWRERPIVTSV